MDNLGDKLSRIWRKVCPDMFREFYESEEGNRGIPIEGTFILLIWGFSVIVGIAAFLDW
ncbi:MAG: hypothetical protein H6918_05170 [Sphingomonadaceae bacterium]|nr:hypothetical protein [Sphingomonadaceae bacterium]